LAGGGEAVPLAAALRTIGNGSLDQSVIHGWDQVSQTEILPIGKLEQILELFARVLASHGLQ
jgi:hypothetical protein